MDWKTGIPTCFGSDDLTLGGHDEDDRRTRTMIGEARGTGSTDDDIRDDVRAYLESKGAHELHIAEQLAKLEGYLSAV